MKTLLLTLTSLLLTLSAHAQGTVNFANSPSTAISNNMTMAPLPAGSAYLVQLYYGFAGAQNDSSFISVTNAAAPLALPGVFLAGTRYTTLAGGATGSFQVRVWDSVLGGSWEAAYASFLSGSQYGFLGKSEIVQVVTGDPNSVPPGTPASLVASGFKGFYIGFPEPSITALGALGVAVLVWRRRRTN